MRVWIQVDITKKLIRGKKFTIERGRAGGLTSSMRGYPTSVIDVDFLLII